MAELVDERHRQSLTQEAVAARAGLTQGCVSGIETGRDARLSTFLSHVDALGYELTLVRKAGADA
ncbi:helix-turn-helix domain-containing protein [Actinomadura sp. DC4]|uniref:helix-turn-helix domain-containing protein n=1 Tax=Actinomadura sp. DC4 TaxID=3055069 RepID=UPI0025AEE8B2|nr:helix-turn-helix domain-containing protein [Actinomadura sp. DC4]MDN3356043.1 helix-turn-helix domain-containing protein [Actinomadura sp. DC4]